MSQLPDKNVEAVIKQMRDRMEQGYIKYQTTTERNDLSLSEWVQHAQEEAMDLAVYLERIKQDVKRLEEFQAHLFDTHHCNCEV